MLYPRGTFTRIILPTIAFLRSSLAVKVRGAYTLKMRAATAPNLPGEPAHQTTHTRGDCHDRSEAGASVLFGRPSGSGHRLAKRARGGGRNHAGRRARAPPERNIPLTLPIPVTFSSM